MASLGMCGSCKKSDHLKEHMAGFSLFGGSADYHQSENGSTDFRLSVFKVSSRSEGSEDLSVPLQKMCDFCDL